MMVQTAEIKTEETGRKYRCQDIVKALEAHIVGSQLAAGVELPARQNLLPATGFPRKPSTGRCSTWPT